MESTFSQSLKLSGMSSTTAIVVWAMIIFLVALILVIAYFFAKQMDNKRNEENKIDKTQRFKKGF